MDQANISALKEASFHSLFSLYGFLVCLFVCFLLRLCFLLRFHLFKTGKSNLVLALHTSRAGAAFSLTVLLLQRMVAKHHKSTEKNNGVKEKGI